MSDVFIAAGVATAALMAGLLLRILRGPTAFDRLVAFNGINTQAILLLLLIGHHAERPELFIDIAYGYAALSLVGSITAAKYLKRTDAVG
ncbi:MAG TPA: monovalent cation/H+ antiporter complex subunit F [bacterium]